MERTVEHWNTDLLTVVGEVKKWKTKVCFFSALEFSINAEGCTENVSPKIVRHVIEWSPSPNSLEVEHQSCKLEVLSSILSLGFTFFIFSTAPESAEQLNARRIRKQPHSSTPCYKKLTSTTAIAICNMNTTSHALWLLLVTDIISKISEVESNICRDDTSFTRLELQRGNRSW